MTATFESRFEACLKGLDVEAPEIEIFPADYGKYRYFGRVVSKTFDGQYEGQRQARVWGHILKTLDENDQARVEFVYTNSPSERAKPANGQ